MRNNAYPEPCASNVLWFVHELADESGTATVTVEHIMTEFNVESEKAQTLLDGLSGFVEKVGANRYRLTEEGMKEFCFLKHFVNVGAKRGVNRIQTFKINKQLREWLGDKVPEGVTGEDAKFLVRLLKPNKKNKWTEEEIERGWIIYENLQKEKGHDVY